MFVARSLHASIDFNSYDLYDTAFSNLIYVVLLHRPINRIYARRRRLCTVGEWFGVYGYDGQAIRSHNCAYGRRLSMTMSTTGRQAAATTRNDARNQAASPHTWCTTQYAMMPIVKLVLMTPMALERTLTCRNTHAITFTYTGARASPLSFSLATICGCRCTQLSETASRPTCDNVMTCNSVATMRVYVRTIRNNVQVSLRCNDNQPITATTITTTTKTGYNNSLKWQYYYWQKGNRQKKTIN